MVEGQIFMERTEILYTRFDSRTHHVAISANWFHSPSYFPRGTAWCVPSSNVAPPFDMVQSLMTRENFTWESKCGLWSLAARKWVAFWTNTKISAVEESGHSTPFTWECVLPCTQPLNGPPAGSCVASFPRDAHQSARTYVEVAIVRGNEKTISLYDRFVS